MRFFNTAGPCRPEINYTVNPLPRLPEVRDLIDGEHYFVIHAPRQTGKTTFLYVMMHTLNREGRYTALQVNVQPSASGRDPMTPCELPESRSTIRRCAFYPKPSARPLIGIFPGNRKADCALIFMPEL